MSVINSVIWSHIDVISQSLDTILLQKGLGKAIPENVEWVFEGFHWPYDKMGSDDIPTYK